MAQQNSQFYLLKKKSFLPLFITQFFGALNDNLFKNALVLLMIYHAADNIEMDMRILTSAAAGIFIFPFFLFSAFAGQVADKFDKSTLIKIIKFIEVVLMLVAAILFFYKKYILLLIVLFFVGVHSAFFGPLKYSILPAHLKKDDLIGANALIEAGTFLAILIGTILGGFLVMHGNGNPYGICIAIFVFALLGLLSSRYIPAAPSSDAHLKLNYNFVQETWNMIAHVVTQPGIFLPIVGISWFWLVGFTFLSQFPIYAKEIIRADEGVVTLFLAIFSIGIAGGSLLCNKLLKGKVSGAYVPLGAFGMTGAIFLFCFSSGYIVNQQDVLLSFTDFLSSVENWGVVLSLFMIAVFGGIYIVPLYALMQVRSPQNHLSRTVAANNIMNAFFMVLGAILSAMLFKMGMTVISIFLIIAFLNIPVAFIIRRVVAANKND